MPCFFASTTLLCHSGSWRKLCNENFKNRALKFSKCHEIHSIFYPRYAMLARVRSSYGPVSVWLSQVGVLTKGTNLLINVIFGTDDSFDQSHTVLRKFRSHKNKCTSLRKFFRNSGVQKFRHVISIVELSSRKVDAQSVINWTAVGQLSWQYLRAPTLDRCSLSSVIVKLCLQHDFVESCYLFTENAIPCAVVYVVCLC